MLGRLPLTARVGFAMVVMPLVCFGSWNLWNDSRRWEPLSTSVSFTSTHASSAEFEINVWSRYTFAMVPGLDTGFVETGPRDVSICGLHVHWVLSRGTRIVAKGVSEPNGEAGRYGWPRRLGTFSAWNGRYILHL